MTTEILINAADYEVRLALVEDGSLAEFHIQRPREQGITGNIYKGRVVRVLPGLQAAFVDIGLERTGFLYVDDVCSSTTPAADPLLCDVEASREGEGRRIEELLTAGQELLVQVSKEPIGTKGARLTCHISLPCRSLVFLPQTDHIGVSRRIEEEALREKIKDKIDAIRPAGVGFIARTLAEFASDRELEADMEYLLISWQKIIDRAKQLHSPALIHRDLDITLRAIRDHFTTEVDSLYIDNRMAWQHLLDHVDTFAPSLHGRIHLYTDRVPLFEAYNIEGEISRAIDKKVWLRSGGYIIIESTEALTVIDVNTGRYVGKNDFGDTIFKTNMEAAAEIAWQLRLRNIGGIIVVDFIDMESSEHRDELYSFFQDAVKRDKSRINILKISEFGIIQMTRKRSSENLHQLMCEPCQCCNGEGMVKSRHTICHEIFRTLERDSADHPGTRVEVSVHPAIARQLEDTDTAKSLARVEQRTGRQVDVVAAADMQMEHYSIRWLMLPVSPEKTA